MGIFDQRRIDYIIAVPAPRCALLLAATAVIGCESSSPTGPAPTATTSFAPLASGTPVVAAVTTVSFRAGTVVRSDDRQVTIALATAAKPDSTAAAAGTTAPTQTVKREAVWPITPLDPQQVTRDATKKGGEHGVCKIEITGRQGAAAAWHPCEITGGAGGKLRVRDEYGRRHTVGADEVVLPGPEIRTSIATFLAREKRHREFDEAVEKAGRPYRPPQWDATAGERVVVHFVGPSWYGGEILEHKRDRRKVRVRYDGGTWDDRDLSPLEVAPVPSAALPVTENGYALVRPDKPTKRWEPVLVTKVEGDVVVALDRDDQERRIPRGDVLPLIPVTPPSDAADAR